jgi:MFS family permease
MAVSPVYLPLFAVEIKHADQLILGGIAAASMVAPLSLSIVIGRLADTIGRKKVIYLTTPVYCVSLLLLIYASSSTILLASGVLQGFFMLSAVTQGAMTAELVPTSLLGRWYGLLGLFRGCVTVLAPVIGGVIWGGIGPEYVFFFLIATQLFKLLILMTMPETLRISRS